jgi:hypothetical protein
MLHTDSHRYTGLITGKDRPSVTTILAIEGLIEKRFYRDGFSEHGTQVHKLLDAVDKGLKWKAPSIYARYVTPYQKMLEQTGIQIIDSEVEVEDVLLGVSGTLDKLCWHPVDGHGIMDVKVSLMGWVPWVEYQTEAYRSGLLWHPKYKGLNIKWRGGIILGPECDIPVLIPHNRIKDISKKWQSIVLGHHAKVEAKVRFEEITAENGW